MQNPTNAVQDRINHVNIVTTDIRTTEPENNSSFTSQETIDTDETFLKERHPVFADSHVQENIMFEKVVFPRPPATNWNLKLFLVALSKEVTDEDLEIVKFLITGDDDNCRGNLETASSLKVFDLLETKKFITSQDLLYLQVILAAVGKDSLIYKVHKYAQNAKYVLHFDPPLKNIVASDQLTDIHVTGADFHIYTKSELNEFCNRVKQMVSQFYKSETSCSQQQLCISVMNLVTTTSRFSTIQNVASGDTLCYDGSGSRPSYTLYQDIGIQTEEEIIKIIDEKTHLKEQLLDAEQTMQKQANEITSLKERIEAAEVKGNILPDDTLSVKLELVSLDSQSETENINMTEKKTHYDLNSLKKQNEILCMKLSSISEECKDYQFKYKKACDNIEELIVEKTNTEIQVGILQRNLTELEAKLKKRINEENILIEELRNKLALATASLLNAQNDKRLYELSRLLEQISSMSMTVKKVYGNFDPAHEHIAPKQDELYRMSLSGKITRIFPQILYNTQKK